MRLIATAITALFLTLLVPVGSRAEVPFGTHAKADSCLILGASFQARAQGRGEWGIAWGTDSAQVQARVLPSEQTYDDVFPAPPTVVVESVAADGRTRALKRAALQGDPEVWRGCTLKVIYDQPSDTVGRLYAGTKRLELVGQVPFSSPTIFRSFRGQGNSKLLRVNVYLDTVAEIEVRPLPPLAAAANTSVEGDWEFLDRDMDSGLASLGGRYRLRVTPCGAGEWMIQLADGADINARLWPAGAVKGWLRATRFADDYDLTWRDSEGRTLSGEMNATLEASGQLLTLRFPLHKATIRFRRR